MGASKEQSGFYDKGDLRSENRELAFKLFFRELNSLTETLSEHSACAVLDLLNRWKVREEEIGTRLSIAISFPAGLVRNQWFYDDQGNSYAKKHDGLPEKVKAKKK